MTFEFGSETFNEVPSDLETSEGLDNTEDDSNPAARALMLDLGKYFGFSSTAFSFLSSASLFTSLTGAFFSYFEVSRSLSLRRIADVVMPADGADDERRATGDDEGVVDFMSKAGVEMAVFSLGSGSFG